MVDTNAYIFFSGATDKTGKALKDALNISGGTKGPTGKKRVVIGWGAKTDKNFPLNADIILNHPDKIRANRNKFSALEIMKKDGVNIADFVTADKVVSELEKNAAITYPLIARTKYHQGGKGLWPCLDKGMVQEAVKEGAFYFQNRIPIKDEYRLHVFDDTLIYAQKKVKRDNPEEAYKNQQKDNLKNAADRSKKQLDDATLDFIINKQAKDYADSPADMLVRSNKKGWKFSHVKEKNIKQDLIDQASKALKAMGLQFGAVDCCYDLDGKPWIIEINTGPGLEGTPFERYTACFDEILKNGLKKVEKAPTTGKTDAVAQGDKVMAASKMGLKEKLALLQEMSDVADDTEAAALEGIAAKMFAGAKKS